jgi:hypothetical protein
MVNSFEALGWSDDELEPPEDGFLGECVEREEIWAEVEGDRT